MSPFEKMTARKRTPLGIALGCLVVLATPGAAPQAAEPDASATPVRALMITGGCCHDYDNQKRLISEGLSKRVGPIEWTILQYGSERDTRADIYERPDWIDGYDIVVHNECFGAIADEAFVRGIVDAHRESGVPAIMIHCSLHSYRVAANADVWRELIGVTSRRHERAKRPLPVRPTEAGAKHPVLDSIGDEWRTPNGELYIIEKVWPSATVLATAYSDETEKDEPVIWINELPGLRVFGTSLGHHNETIASDQWQAIVAAGWKWAMNRDESTE